MKKKSNLQQLKNPKNSKNPKNLKILIRLPNWLGDATMSTPSLELLKEHFSKARFCLVAPNAVLEVFRGDKRIESFIPDESKKAKCRFSATYALARQIKAEFGTPDIAITLTNHFFSALFLRFLGAKNRVGYKRAFDFCLLNKSVPKLRNTHQVISYVNLAICALDSADLGDFVDLAKKANVASLKDLANNASALESITPNLALHLAQNATLPSEFLEIFSQNKSAKSPKIIGLNPAAAYGSAKRWLPEYFAQVASHFALRGEKVVIFGTKSDYELGEFIKNNALDFAKNPAQNLAQNLVQDFGQNPKSSPQKKPQNQTQNLAKEITQNLKSSPQKLSQNLPQNPTKNIHQKILNLCGKTDIAGLMKAISQASVMITNDSGPMHISCALGVPVIALFGPTKSEETNGFRAKNFVILRKNLPCAPCKKRECPLPKGDGHHKCMVDLHPLCVIEEATKILQS